MNEKQLEIKERLTEIAAQETADKNAVVTMQLAKIHTLAEVLGATFPENNGDFSPFLPVIQDEINRRLIEGKIVELVKGL